MAEAPYHILYSDEDDRTITQAIESKPRMIGFVYGLIINGLGMELLTINGEEVYYANEIPGIENYVYPEEPTTPYWIFRYDPEGFQPMLSRDPEFCAGFLDASRLVHPIWDEAYATIS